MQLKKHTSWNIAPLLRFQLINLSDIVYHSKIELQRDDTPRLFVTRVFIEPPTVFHSFCEQAFKKKHDDRVKILQRVNTLSINKKRVGKYLVRAPICCVFSVKIERKTRPIRLATDLQAGVQLISPRLFRENIGLFVSESAKPGGQTSEPKSLKIQRETLSVSLRRA